MDPYAFCIILSFLLVVYLTKPYEKMIPMVQSKQCVYILLFQLLPCVFL